MGKWKEQIFDDLKEGNLIGLVRNKKQQSFEFEFDYLKMNNITDDGNLDLISLVKVDASIDEVKKYTLKKGDFLFNTRNSVELVGKTAIYNEESIKPRLFNNNIMRSRFKKGFDPYFINYQFQSSEFKERLEKIKSGTTSVAAIYYKSLKDIKLKFPPLPEQQRIVAKLDGLFAKIDQAIGLLEENIAHTKALMGSVLDEEFSKLECKWFKLEEVTTMVGGGTPKTAISEYWAEEVVWLSPTDLPPIGVISKVSNSGKKISKLGLQKCSAKLLPIGTVVFSSRASIGKIAITECELATNQGFTNFIPNEGVDNMYLAKTLKHYTPKIEALSNSTTFKEVSKTSLKSFKIPLPNIETQLKLSKLFSDYQKNIDGIVLIQIQKLNHLKALKSSLLDQAFKGEL